MRVTLRGEPDYPCGLLNLADPPPLLFLRGRVELLGTPGVAVVGARRATARGRDVALRLGRALGAAGVPVVSGLARGVDGAAHHGALEAGGTTVAVLGSGAERAYPRSHERLFRGILEKGLVVSEFPPGTEPLPHHFPRRNRILAALSRAVVVVEAGRKSGALITVDHALDLGLDVYAVPGPIDVPSCEGSNRLLQDGARAIVSVEGFVREITGAEVEDPPARAAGLDGDAGRILALLEGGSVHADEVARRLELDVGRTLALLATLEVRGWVEQVPGMRFRRAG
jgi:DNA processing protein